MRAVIAELGGPTCCYEWAPASRYPVMERLTTMGHAPQRGQAAGLAGILSR